MEGIFINIGICAGVTILSLFITTVLFKGKKFIDIEKRKEECEELVKTSKKEADEVLMGAKNNLEKRKNAIEDDVKKRTARIEKLKESLKYKENNISKKEEKLKEFKLKIASYQEENQSLKNSLEKNQKETLQKLSEKARISPEELKKEILNSYEKELETNSLKKLAETEELLKEDAKKIATSVLIGTIQRISAPTSVETRTVLIKVPKDHIKGKIVGKDGKNIEEIEKNLDVAIVFNDLPQTISIASHDLITRRIAEKTIEKLIAKRGEIDKTTITGTIEEAKKETIEELYKIGEEACEKMGIPIKDKKFAETVGRLKYRTSYGQNIMKHAMEVGWIAVMLGSELGLDIKICKTAGFLHDLGKAIDQDPEIKDAHDQLTKDLMEKYKFSEDEIHAAWAHHDAERQKTPEALIIKAADAVSGGRPGARQDSIEKYLEKIQAIENTVGSFSGVTKSYTMSAGREVRVLVNPEEIKDEKVLPMAVEIAKKLEENVTYPGKIKVNVIRRVKSLEIAR